MTLDRQGDQTAHLSSSARQCSPAQQCEVSVALKMQRAALAVKHCKSRLAFRELITQMLIITGEGDRNTALVSLQQLTP